MTPQEYLIIERNQLKIMSRASAAIRKARIEANKCKMPNRVRPVNKSDLVKGAIVWHRNPDFWNIIFEPRHDCYIADDGCFYWLKTAYVEIEQCTCPKGWPLKIKKSKVHHPKRNAWGNA